MPSSYQLTDSILTLDGYPLSEHNRAPLSVDFELINRSARTVEGRMRRQHVASKKTFSVSWEELPHTAAYTVDGKAGAYDMINFLNSKLNDSLTLTVTYNSAGSSLDYEVLIESFDYEVTKRWEYELWNVSLSLIEV